MIDHMNLAVSDFARSKAFYARALVRSAVILGRHWILVAGSVHRHASA